MPITRTMNLQKQHESISEFTQEYLSNWYVRFSRRRFGKGSMKPIKYQHIKPLYLYGNHCKVGAPIAPFFMDRLYLDLKFGTNKETFESVHLADFPTLQALY